MWFIESYWRKISGETSLLQNAELLLPQTTYSTFDDDTDSGVLCRICDCWLPGQREFERHCDELHPVAADPDSTTVPQTWVWLLVTNSLKLPKNFYSLTWKSLLRCGLFLDVSFVGYIGAFEMAFAVFLSVKSFIFLNQFFRRKLTLLWSMIKTLNIRNVFKPCRKKQLQLAPVKISKLRLVQQAVAINVSDTFSKVIIMYCWKVTSTKSDAFKILELHFMSP